MAAIETVRALLVAKMQSLGFSILQFRDENDAISIDEMPCAAIEEGDTEIIELEGRAGGTMLHRATFFMTFAAVATTGASARTNAYAMLGLAANALLVDYNLGGNVVEVKLVKYGGEEQMANDAAAILLETAIDFCTSTSDWNTLVT